MFSTPNFRVRPAASENAFSLTAKKSLTKSVKKTAFQDISVNITPFNVKGQKKHVTVKKTNSIKKDLKNNEDNFFDLMTSLLQDKDTYEDIMSSADYNNIREGFHMQYVMKTPPPLKTIIEIDSRHFEPAEEVPLDDFIDSFTPWHNVEDVSLPDISF